MGISDILLQLDFEIEQLQRARAILQDELKSTGTGQASAKKKRNITPEGRKRIAEAVKRRWDRQKNRKS